MRISTHTIERKGLTSLLIITKNIVETKSQERNIGLYHIFINNTLGYAYAITSKFPGAKSL